MQTSNLKTNLKMRNNHFTKRVVHHHDGLSFDSLTEVEYYKRFNQKGYMRNEKKFIIWSGSHGGGSISYTPDFIKKENEKTIWVEVKGVKHAVFALREQLIKEYCKVNKIMYIMVQLDKVDNKFKTEADMKNAKSKRVLSAQEELKVLWNLWDERKSLTEDEYKTVLEMIENNTYSYLRTGRMVQKAKYFNQIKRKLKNIKDKLCKIKKLHTQYKLSKTS